MYNEFVNLNKNLKNRFTQRHFFPPWYQCYRSFQTLDKHVLWKSKSLFSRIQYKRVSFAQKIVFYILSLSVTNKNVYFKNLKIIQNSYLIFFKQNIVFQNLTTFAIFYKNKFVFYFQTVDERLPSSPTTRAPFQVIAPQNMLVLCTLIHAAAAIYDPCTFLPFLFTRPVPCGPFPVYR